MDTLYSLSHLGPQVSILWRDPQAEKVENVWLHFRQRYGRVVRIQEAVSGFRLVLVCLCLLLVPIPAQSEFLLS